MNSTELTSYDLMNESHTGLKIAGYISIGLVGGIVIGWYSLSRFLVTNELSKQILIDGIVDQMVSDSRRRYPVYAPYKWDRR